MGLSRQLAQSLLGMIERIALGAKGRIAQTRTAVFRPRPIAPTVGAAVTHIPSTGATPSIPSTPGIAGITGTAALAGPAAGTLPPGASRGLGPAGTGSVVATHGDHRLGRSFDGRGRWCRFGSCGFGHSLIGLRRIAILGALLRGFRRSGGIRSGHALRGRRLRGQLV